MVKEMVASPTSVESAMLDTPLLRECGRAAVKDLVGKLLGTDGWHACTVRAICTSARLTPAHRQATPRRAAGAGASFLDTANELMRLWESGAAAPRRHQAALSASG